MDPVNIIGVGVGGVVAKGAAQTAGKKALDLAIKKANSFIAYRPRSISEVENKLLLSFNENVVKNVICNLKEQDILNDLRFAKLWVTSRCLSNQKSTQYIKYELKQTPQNLSPLILLAS